MRTVAVVGAGISGLAAAQRLVQLQPGLRVVVLEAAARVGGKLKRARVGGCWVDVGAEAMLARRPEGLALAESNGLARDLIHPQTTAALLRVGGATVALPARTLLGIPSDLQALRDSGLFGTHTLQRIATEPDRGPYPPLAADISVGQLVEQRFGREVVERLVDPLLGGVYAARAEDISLQLAIPALASRLMSHGGSLLHNAQQLIAAGRPLAGTPIFASVAGGLARLPAVLAADPRIEVRLSCPVRDITYAGGQLKVRFGLAAEHQSVVADAVILAGPAAKSGGMVAGLVPGAAAELAQIDTAAMVIVTLAFRGLPAGALPAGSGMLLPEREGLPIKALTFSSQKWPGVGSESGVTLLRASLGRAGDQRDLQRTDAELISIVATALNELTGLTAESVDSHVQRWGGGLPQYPSGHAARVQQIRAEMSFLPNVALCGASYDGVGIPACIASGQQAADRVLDSMRRRGQ